MLPRGYRRGQDITLLPCIFLRWNRGEPRKLFLKELRRVLQGTEGLGGGVGLGVPVGLSFGVCTGVPLGVGRGLPLGDGRGVTCVMGTDLPLWSGWRWRWWRRRGVMGGMGDSGMESLGATVRGGWRLTRGLLGMQGAKGVLGVEGSDLGVVGVLAVVGRGFDLVVCRGFSDTLGLAGRVCVRGCMRGDPIFGW